MQEATHRDLLEDWKADAFDPVVEVFKRDLRLTTDERAKQLSNAVRFIAKFRQEARRKAEA